MSPIGYDPDAGGAREQIPTSPECTSALGDWLQLRWSSFGVEPEERVPFDSEVGAMTGAAGVLLFSAYGGFDRSDGDVFSRVELDGACNAPGSCIPLLIELGIRSVALGVHADSTGYSVQDGAVIVDIREHPYADMTYATYPVGVASSLVHEAAHDFDRPHIRCVDAESEACDADERGAWGAELMFLQGWGTAIPKSYASIEERVFYDQAIQRACDCINDPSAVPTCSKYHHRSCESAE